MDGRGDPRHTDSVAALKYELTTNASGLRRQIAGFALSTNCRFSAVHRGIKGAPDLKHVSTSYVERLNWSTRTSMRRYTRLSNGFSRKLENHEAAVALNYFAYNFIKIHRTLRTSPAMAAGVTTRLFEVSDLVNLLVEAEPQKAA